MRDGGMGMAVEEGGSVVEMRCLRGGRCMLLEEEGE